MESIYPFLVVTHVLSAITWVGGVIFIGAVAVPIARRLPAADRRKIITSLGERFRPVGWTALTLLVITGSLMAWRWGARLDNLLDLSFFKAPHTRLLGYKLIAVTLMIAVSFVHDWILGPKAAKTEIGSVEEARVRRKAAYMGQITAALVLFIVVIAVFIARPWLAA